MAHGGPRPGSGRPKGSPNKLTLTVQETLARLGVNPLEGMSTIACNELPCGVCRGTGKSFYKLPAGQHASDCDGSVIAPATLCHCEGIGTRKCESCYGTLFEACSPELRGKMHAELAQYVAPKRKAIDHTNSDGTLRPQWVVVDPQAKQDKPQ